MRRTLLGIGLLTLLTAAGCGAADPGTAAPPSTSAVGPSTSTPVSSSPEPNTMIPSPTGQPPTNGPAVPAAQIDYSQFPEGFPRSVTTQDKGRTLVVMGEEGGCAKLSGKVLEQNADHVKVQLLTTVESHRMCPLYVRQVPVAVQLDAPLGTRKLVLTAQTA